MTVQEMPDQELPDQDRRTKCLQEPPARNPRPRI